jgi:hypothetical protein
MLRPDDQTIGDFLSDLHMFSEEYGLVLGCGGEGLLIRPMTDEGSRTLLSAEVDEAACWDEEAP